MTDRQIKNARILEAFGMIDEKYIGEVASSLKLDDYSEEPPKPSLWKSLKPIFAIAACIMLLGALFPVTMMLINRFAGTAGADPYSLSRAELDAINEAWGGDGFAESPEDVGYLSGTGFIYGKYDGAIPLGRSSLTAMYAEESVAGCIFKYTTGVSIKVYYEGKIYGLSEAYESGILSAAQIKDIWRKHQINILHNDEDFEDDYIYGDYLNPIEGLEPLTKSGVSEINALWADRYPDFEGDIIDIDRLNRGLSYRYLGSFTGHTVIWIAGSGEAETKKIRDFEFSYSSSFDIIVFYNGSTVDFIEEAAEKWMIDTREIELIHARCREYEDYFANRPGEDHAHADIPKPRYPVFTPDLEPLTRRQMYDIRDAYADFVYLSMKSRTSEAEAHAAADDAWHDLFGEDIENVRYYGIIDEEAVFFLISADLTVNVGEWVSFIPATYTLVYSFSQKKFSSVNASYFSEEGVYKFAQRHNQYLAYLSQLKISKILERYFGDDVYEDPFGYELLTTFDDCLVVVQKTGWTALRKYSVGGYTFTFPTLDTVWVCREDEKCELDEAYAKGYLSDDDLAQLYASCHALYPNLNS